MEEEIKNLTKEDVLEIIKDFPIEPRERRVIITVNVEELEEDEVNLGGNSFNEVQYVIAKGSYVQDLEPGDKVILDLKKMTIDRGENVGQIQIDPIEVNGRYYATIYDSLIKHKDKR